MGRTHVGAASPHRPASNTTMRRAESLLPSRDRPRLRFLHHFISWRLKHRRADRRKRRQTIAGSGRTRGSNSARLRAFSNAEAPMPTKRRRFRGSARHGGPPHGGRRHRADHMACRAERVAAGLGSHRHARGPDCRRHGTVAAARSPSRGRCSCWAPRRAEADPRTKAGDIHHGPSWAVIATDDKAFDQRMLQTMAKRIGATIKEVKASHAVFMTQSAFVADVIDEAARNAVRSAR
jgi:hypothetical protein